jgi:hypothetical protein
MNTAEDRLRAAARAVAGTVPPGSAPPLHLPEHRSRVPRPRWPRGRRWQGWLVPLAAAATVTAVVAGTLAVPRLLHARPSKSRHAAAAGGAFAGLPSYYVTLTGKGGFEPYDAVVRATATGAVAGTVTPPKPYQTFTAAAGDAAGRAFVLAASGDFCHPNTQTRYFALRIRDHGVRLTALPIPPSHADVSGIALSRDGRRLAVASGTRAEARIVVYTVATGAKQVWTWPVSQGAGNITNNAGGNGEVLSWADDGTLAFQEWRGIHNGNLIDVRLLDTSTGGGSLQADSRQVLQWPGDGAPWPWVHGKASNIIVANSAIITGDGSKIVAATVTYRRRPGSHKLADSSIAFTEFSTSTGKPLRNLGVWQLHGLFPAADQDVVWSNATGSRVIVLAHQPGEAVPDTHQRCHPSLCAKYRMEYGLQTPHRFIPLPAAPSTNGPGPEPSW